MYIDDVTQYMIYALKTKGKHFSPPKQIRNKRPVSIFLPDLRLNFNLRNTGRLHQTGHWVCYPSHSPCCVVLCPGRCCWSSPRKLLLKRRSSCTDSSVPLAPL